MRRSVWVLMAVVVHVVPAAAQEPTAEPAPRWAFNLGLALNSSGGNERLTVLTTQADLTRLATEAFELSLSGRLRYGRSQGEDLARNVRGGVTVDLRPLSRWSPFLFSTVEHDPFKKLNLRTSGGLGAKHTFWGEGWEDLSLSGAVLFSYENLDTEATDPLDATLEQLRLSWRFRVRRKMGAVRLEQITYWQPLWDRASDYLLESRSMARVSVTESWSVTATYFFERDSTPPEGVRADDYTVTVGVELATRF